MSKIKYINPELSPEMKVWAERLEWAKKEYSAVMGIPAKYFGRQPTGHGVNNQSISKR